jgi:SAM-dependent methyltransferase
VTRRFLALARRIRRGLNRRWSPDSDREFHDALFAAARHDPFSRSYPGYVTIRRFADFAVPFVERASSVVDLGCGPGEISCELARRFPAVSFLGVDHSPIAIARARDHARTLSLENIRFEEADLMAWMPARPLDVALMFDSFHHLADPRSFVRRLAPVCPRFMLIEPAGDALGRWQAALEFDWVLSELDKIRCHIEYDAGQAAPRLPAGRRDDLATLRSGEAVEHRYPVEDYLTFLPGYGLTIQGTVAGFDAYPPDPYQDTPLRSRFFDFAYEMIVEIDERLGCSGADLHAKHRVIYAERGAPHRLRTPPSRRVGPGSQQRVQGPYDVIVEPSSVPRRGRPGERAQGVVRVTNRGWKRLDSMNQEAPVFFSYHWLSPDGGIVEYDGLRTPFPQALEPGGAMALTFRLAAPAAPGRYVLELDLVEEGVTWFGAAGVATVRIPFVVDAPGA